MRKKLLLTFFVIPLIFSIFSATMIGVTAAQVTHDVAVVSVTPSPTSVEEGELVNITVVVENQGTMNETFDVTVYYDTTDIETKNVGNLVAGANTSLTFAWNTTGVWTWEGPFKVSATASTVSGETDTGDNTLVSLSMVRVFESPYIGVVPHSTVDTTLTPGMNYTVSIYTDYIGTTRIRNMDTWIGDGTTTTFTTTRKPVVPYSEVVYVYVFLKTRDVDYSIDYAAGKITFTTAPEEGAEVKATYLYVDTWIGDGTTTTFTTTRKPVVPYSEVVYVDEILKTRDVDYSIDYAAGKITFTTAPEEGAEVKATYLYGDIWSYEFTLTYNPNVLHGVKVTNGDLITKAKNETATFQAGEFDNTLGKLSMTGASFLHPGTPLPVTYGPGTLANVTFTVVGTGDSDIELGTETVAPSRLVGWDPVGEYNIIDDWTPDRGHILHGYFRNTIEEPVHDIVVVSVTVSNTSVVAGEPVNITVVIKNNGTVTETGIEVKVYYDFTVAGWLIGMQNVSTLVAGANTSLTFTWNTTDVGEGDHTVIAKAIPVPGEDYTENNMLESNETVKVTLPREQPLPIELIIGVVVAAVVVIAVVAYAVKRRKKPTPQ